MRIMDMSLNIFTYANIRQHEYNCGYLPDAGVANFCY